jgi:NADH-quinone oxidoreductase subunit J
VEGLVFALTGASLLVMAGSVALAKSPLRSALALIVALVNLAILFVMLEAPFVASMQVLVYAGAIMVLFLFVIMLLNLRPDAPTRPGTLLISGGLGSLAAVYLVGRLLVGSLPATSLPMRGHPGAAALDGTVRHIGQLLLTDFLFNFEAISLLLLVAVVGAVTLGLKRAT